MSRTAGFPPRAAPGRERFGLVAVDLDGTLLNRERRIARRDRDALCRVEREGVAAAVISGRRFEELEDLTASLPPTVFRAGHGGALIRRNGRTLLRLPLARETARAALECTAGMDLITLVSGGGGSVRIRAADPGSARVRRYLASVRPPPRLEAAPRFENDPIHLAFVGTPGACRRAERRLRDRIGGRATLARTEYLRLELALLDVVSPEAGKGAALRAIAADAGVSLGATLAIGDNWNDLEMLRTAGLGVVMGNADPELRRLGFGTTGGNDACGVAEALDRLVPPR